MLILLAVGAILSGAPPTKPHVVMFLQDDLGHDDVSFTGGNAVNAVSSPIHLWNGGGVPSRAMHMGGNMTTNVAAM